MSSSSSFKIPLLPKQNGYRTQSMSNSIGEIISRTYPNPSSARWYNCWVRKYSKIFHQFFYKNFHQSNSSSSQSLTKLDRKIAKNSKNSKKSALSPTSRNPRKTYPDISSARNQVQKFQSPDLKVWRVPPIDKATRTDLWLGLEFILGTNCGSQESVKSGKGSHRVK